MSDFKVGDKVVRVDMDLTCVHDRKVREAFKNGDVLTVVGFYCGGLVFEEVERGYLKRKLKLLKQKWDN